MSSSTFAQDEITRGVRHAFATGTVPIWVSFGIQTFLDIQDVLSADIEKPFQDLSAHLQYASDMLAKDLQVRCPSLPTGHKDTHINRATRILSSIDEWTMGDMLGSMLRQQPGIQSHSVLGSVAAQPGYFLKHHPLRCGMLKHNVYMQLHATGTGVESQATTLSTLAHLYVACRLNHPENPVWPDMEFMMERQDRNRLFMGAPPKSFVDAQKKLALAFGASTTNFARGRRNDKPVINLDKTQLFAHRSIIGQLYQNRMYKEPSTREATDLTRKLIRIIKTSRKDNKTSMNSSEATAVVSSKSQRNWKPLELLEELREWLVEDGIDLNFDWFGKRHICNEIWSKIKNALVEIGGDSVKGNGSVLHIAGGILALAANRERILEDDKTLRNHIQGQNADIASELGVVRIFINEAILAKDTPPNRPTGWIGDRCIRHLLHVNPEAIRPLARPGGLNAKKLYDGWDLEGMQTSSVERALDEFVNVYNAYKKDQERLERIDVGEVKCEDCGEKHVPGEHKLVAPQHKIYFCSPIVRSAWGEKIGGN